MSTQFLIIRYDWSTPSPTVLRHELHAKVQALKNHPTDMLTKEVDNETKRLRASLDTWRMQQRDIMPQVRDYIASHATDSVSLFEEQLFLPSAFTMDQRAKFSLNALAAIESSLREGAEGCLV